MNGSGDRPNEIRPEPGLPLENIKHCKIGAICWFTRNDGSKWYRDLGIIIDKSERDGVIIIQSLTTLAGLPERYDEKTGVYNRIPKHGFGCPIKTNLDSVRAHLRKLSEGGQELDMRDVSLVTGRVIRRAISIDKSGKK